MRGIALSAVVVALALAAGIGLAAEVQRGVKENTMKNEGLEYGFRYDPMKWIEESGSVQAAQVRALLLERPKEGDKETLQAEIDRILSDRQADGSLGDDTTGKLIRLSRLGCSPDRPEVQSAVKHIFGDDERTRDGLIGTYGLYIADWVDYHDTDLIARSTRKLASHVMTMDFWRLCPWGGQVHTRGMWSGRKHADVTPALERGLNIMLSDIDERKGWPRFLDPFGFLDASGNIDHPLTGQIVIKQIPLILRTQQADGTWGGMKHLGYGPDHATYVVLRALIKWDLLDELRGRTPLPPDWEIVRSVPVPKGKLSMLASGGERLWFYDEAAGEAVGVSPDDGSEVTRVKLPAHVRNIGWQDGRLAVVRVVEFVENDWDVEGVVLMDVDGNEPPREATRRTWRGSPWRINDFYGGAPVLEKGGPGPDWGEAPFCRDTTGIAWDGKSLWALDGKQNRICLIRKTESGRTLTDDPPAHPMRVKMAVASPDKTYDIPRLDAPQPDEDWSERGFRVNVFAQLNRGVPQIRAGDSIFMFEPMRAAMHLAWNADALLLRIEAADDHVVEADTVEELWRTMGDCVLLDIAPRPGVNAYRRLAIGPGTTEDHPDVRVLCSRSLVRSQTPQKTPFDRVDLGDNSSVRVTRMRADDGYALDVVVPWQNLDMEPQVGDEIGLQVFVLNRDTAGPAPLTGVCWCPGAGPTQSACETHRVRLSEHGGSPVTAVIEDGPGGLDIAVTAVGKFAGERVTVLSGDDVMAEAVLMEDRQSGYAIGSIPMPLPASEPLIRPRVMLDGTCIGELQKAGRRR